MKSASLRNLVLVIRAIDCGIVRTAGMEFCYRQVDTAVRRDDCST